MSGCSPGKTGTPFHTAAVWFLRIRAFPSRFDASSLVLPPFYKTLLHFPLNNVRKQSKYANKAAKCRVYCLLPLKHMTNFGLFGCAVKGFMGLCSIILTRRHRYRSPRALDSTRGNGRIYTICIIMSFNHNARKTWSLTRVYKSFSYQKPFSHKKFFG